MSNPRRTNEIHDAAGWLRSERLGSVRSLGRSLFGLISALAVMAALLLPTPAGASVSIFADASNSGDAVRWKGWAVGANPDQVFSWRIQLWQEHGDFDVLIDEHTKSNFRGSTSFQTPTYYSFVASGGIRYCVKFYLYRRSTPTRTPARTAQDCVTH